MFSSNLRFVPWKNRDEFLRVYQDAYSGDRDRQVKACQCMELWIALRNDAPPGVECTLNILSAFHQEDLSSRHKQLTYSTAVLRVVNMLCDNARNSGKETLYSIAKYYNLPDWIVNLRHDVSHGTALPDIFALERAATFLLTWLREYYWEVEKDEIKDIVLKRSRYEACKTNTEFYINTYLNIMELKKIEGDIRIKQIKDENLMLQLFDVNSFRGFNCAIECIPWIIHSKDNFSKEINKDNIPEMKLSAFSKSLLQQLQDYVTKCSFWQVDVLPLVVDVMFEHYTLNNSIDRDVWGLLMDKLNEWKMMVGFLQVLSDENRLNHNASNVWLSEIIRAVTKRYFSDRIRVDLSVNLIPTGNIEEEKIAAETILRKRLHLELKSNEAAVQNKLFSKVEKKHSELKEVFRFTTPVHYLVDNCSAMKIIKSLVLNPNKYTISHLNLIFQILNPELTEKKKEKIINLVSVRLGTKTINKLPMLNNYKPKTLVDLKRFVQSKLSDKNQFKNVHSKANVNVEMESNTDTINLTAVTSESNIERSGWDFSKCPLGVTPWEMDNTEYYNKTFNPHIPCHIFPFAIQN